MTKKILLALILTLSSTACGPKAERMRGPRPPSSLPATYQPGASGDALIYVGASAWTPEAISLKEILNAHGARTAEADSGQLDSMTLDQLTSFNLLVVPGGDAPTITASLSAASHQKIRDAVQLRGMNYIGFCAGAWIAVAPAPEQGKDVEYGLGIVDGPMQEQTRLFKEGRHFALEKAQFPDKTKRELLWYGGPVTPDIEGGVIAKYSDGTPAITQIQSGKGFVIISGLHPAAPQYVFDSLGLRNTEALAYEFAWSLLDAALHGKPMKAF